MYERNLNSYGFSLKVIPVIDILNGVAVHAIRGERSNYKPLQSSLFKSADPVDVAGVFKTLGFRELYVADLDAIIDCSNDFHTLKGVVNETGLSLIVDAGITNIDRAQRLFESGVSKLVIGTETLLRKGFVAEAVKRFGSDKVVLSLDLKDGEVLVKPGFDGCRDPMCLLDEFSSMGISQIIILDLDRVGSSMGVDFSFLKDIIDKLNSDVYAGGGVRDITDLQALKEVGAAGALVSTAIHTGKITAEDLKHLQFM